MTNATRRAVAPDADVHAFFSGKVEAALAESPLAPSPTTRAYLVDLLARYAQGSFADELDRPLVFRLDEAASLPEPRARLAKLRAVGDDAMVLCGFFDAHLERRGLERRYVGALGSRAYSCASSLGRLAGAAAVAYAELAEGFLAYATVLDEVRELTALRTPQDIVRLYERWKRSPSARLAERLRAAGVYPQAGPGGRLLH